MPGQLTLLGAHGAQVLADPVHGGEEFIDRRVALDNGGLALGGIFGELLVLRALGGVLFAGLQRKGEEQDVGEGLHGAGFNGKQR